MTNDKTTRRGNDAAMANIACGIVFCVFTFIYLFFYQDELLKMEQHVLSGGVTTYNRTIGAIILTSLLMLLQAGVDTLTGKRISHPALTYMPSAVLLAMLTDISPDIDSGYKIGKWAWLAPLALAAAAGSGYLSIRMTEGDGTADRRSAFRVLWENLALTFIILMFVCTAANTDRRFHARIKIDNLVAEGNYRQALLVQTCKNDADSSATMLRAYALSRLGLLGEKLFEYPLTGGSDALLPNRPTTKSMASREDEIFSHVARPVKQHMKPMRYLQWARSHNFAKKPLEDYMLCALLLDKKVELFAKELLKRKKRLDGKLPKHYKEALVLYNHLRSTPVITYQNSVMDADFNDLQAIMHGNSEPEKRKALAGMSYGNTYWYYYYYGNEQTSRND